MKAESNIKDIIKLLGDSGIEKQENETNKLKTRFNKKDLISQFSFMHYKYTQTSYEEIYTSIKSKA